ncbi:MAG: 6-hydroxynicotinate reductase [Janthinobacterium lividum]
MTTHAAMDEPEATALDAARQPAVGGAEIVTCDACPVLCRIRLGRTGACDRYGNVAGALTRMDPLVLLPDGTVTAIGAGTTYPDYKPAPFIVGSRVHGIDTVTVVSEGVFSYCGLKLKIDTDRFLGPETATVRARGEAVGHVTTAEYGSQMLSLGGVHHLTGGSKKEGVATCAAVLALANKQPVELTIDGGAVVTVQAGRAPVIDGQEERRMRVGCGSATIGIFGPQWREYADEVIVVDDHITGVLTEHQAGRFLDMRPSGIRVRGRRSTPGRYFQVANPGLGWGGTDIQAPLEIIERIDPALAWPGLRLLMVSTTGEHSGWFVLDAGLAPQPAPMPEAIRHAVARIGDNCEPALCTVLFMAGAGGSLRAGAVDNPVLLTRSVQAGRTRVTSGGAPVTLWPGGGITYMVDVLTMPDAAFGSVPTPALVAPIEFTLPRAEYAALGGYLDRVQTVDQVLAARAHVVRR